MKHKKVNLDDYIHAKEYLSYSSVERYKKSPLYKHEYIYEPPTDAMIVSSASHCYILDPQEFDRRFWVLDPEKKPSPNQTFGANVNKEWREEQSAGRDIIKKEDFEKIRLMKQNLFRDFMARSLVMKGQAEQGILVEDFNGVKVKIKPDYFKDNSIVDLKFVRDASEDKFIRDVSNYNWHIEAAFFTDVLQEIDNKTRTFYFIAIEKAPPYDHAIYRPTAQMIGVGVYEYEAIMEQHKYCLETGDFQGYRVFADNKFGVKEINLPTWKIKELKFHNEFTINKINKK